MVRQDELAFMRAISTLQVSPALLKELKLTMARRKKPAVSAEKHSTTGSGTRASQQLAGKLKANELASSDDSMEPANRSQAPCARSVPLPTNSTSRANKLLPAAGNPDHPG